MGTDNIESLYREMVLAELREISLSQKDIKYLAICLSNFISYI